MCLKNICTVYLRVAIMYIPSAPVFNTIFLQQAVAQHELANIFREEPHSKHFLSLAPWICCTYLILPCSMKAATTNIPAAVMFQSHLIYRTGRGPQSGYSSTVGKLILIRQLSQFQMSHVQSNEVPQNND